MFDVDPDTFSWRRSTTTHVLAVPCLYIRKYYTAADGDVKEDANHCGFNHGKLQACLRTIYQTNLTRGYLTGSSITLCTLALHARACFLNSVPGIQSGRYCTS